MGTHEATWRRAIVAAPQQACCPTQMDLRLWRRMPGPSLCALLFHEAAARGTQEHDSAEAALKAG